jgi:hypothetical protein
MRRDRSKNVTLTIQHRGECQGGGRIVRPQLDGPADTGKCGVVLVKLRQQQAQIGQGGRMIRPQQMGVLELLGRLQRLAASRQCNPAREAGRGRTWITRRALVRRRGRIGSGAGGVAGDRRVDAGVVRFGPRRVGLARFELIRAGLIRIGLIRVGPMQVGRLRIRHDPRNLRGACRPRPGRVTRVGHARNGRVRYVVVICCWSIRHQFPWHAQYHPVAAQLPAFDFERAALQRRALLDLTQLAYQDGVIAGRPVIRDRHLDAATVPTGAQENRAAFRPLDRLGQHSREHPAQYARVGPHGQMRLHGNLQLHTMAVRHIPDFSQRCRDFVIDPEFA